MRWALVAHPDQFIRGRLVQAPRTIPEDSMATAQAQGWIVLGCDSELAAAVNLEQNLQQNPNRTRDYGEQ